MRKTILNSCTNLPPLKGAGGVLCFITRFTKDTPLKRGIVWCVLAICALIINACSASRPLQETASSQEKLHRELTRLRDVIKANPNAHEAVRDLGIVLVEMKEHKNAAILLEKALRHLPEDALTYLSLGLAYEALQRWNDALKLYRAGVKLPANEYRSQMRGRLEFAIQGKLREEARQALASEKNLAPSRLPENSIAVLKFLDLGSSPDLAPLATGLADMIITDLSQAKSLIVIERSRIHALMEEMGLGQSGLVEETTAPRVGNLLGARKILQGSFLEAQEKELRLDANLAEVTQARVKSAGKVSGELARFFRLEKDLVFKVIRELGVQLSDAERKAILALPTENLLAFLAYARGLEARDRGEYEKAEQEFQNAVQADAKFVRAQAQLERTRSMRQTLAMTNAPIRMLRLRPRLALQQRRLQLAQATTRTNPGFSFVNQGRVSLLAPRLNNLPAGKNNPRQPLLEGRADFGLPGEIRIDIKLP